MSTTIDQRVVEMRFDNRHFESNVATTMSTLDRLKGSLSLDDTARSMSLKFDAMYSMTDQFVRRITDRVMNFGERIVKSLTIDPISTGFKEYETQIGAIQTIWSNTKSKGTTLDDVNSALDELNTYADKTIYNFTEMTRNIGTFTAAGVDLDTSVSAIKGIANLAAVSGSTSQQASTAMYQLSQAMASGTVKLMDWNSVVNAGMGGQVFQDALKETAKVHGVAIDDIIKKQGSFRESLSEGWLTTDILTETLSKFTGDLTEEQLKTMGYTEEQIKGIMELGKDANDAATKVKTLTQLFDTLAEAAQSGWAQSWEIIVGDFEEAKDLFTQVSDVISGMIGDSAAARNDMLENWKVLGGRTDLIDALSNTFHGVMAIVGAVKEAFTDIFPPLTAEKLADFTEGLKVLTEKLKNISGGTLDKIKRTFKGLFALIDIGVLLFKALARGVGDLLGHLAPAGKGLLGFTAGLGDALVALRDFIESSGVFNLVVGKIVDILGVCIKVIGKFISLIVSGFKKLGEFAMPGIESFVDRVETRFGQLRSFGEGLKNVFSSIGNFFKGIFTAISPLIKGIGDMISKLFTSIKDSFKEGDFDTLNDILNVGLTGGLGVLVAKIVSIMSNLENVTDVSKLFKKLKLDKIVKGVNEVVDGVTGCFKAFQSSLKADVLMKIAKAIAILTAALVILSLIDSEKLTIALTAITTLFLELFTCMKIFDGLDMVKAKKGEFAGIQSTATSLIGIAVTMLLLSFVVAKLGSMDPESLIKGLFGTLMLLMTLAYSMQYFAVGIDKGTKKAEKSIIKGTRRLIAITTALAALAGVVVLLGSMDFKDMMQGILGMYNVVAALAVIMLVMNKTGKISSSSGFSILMAAGALIVIAKAMEGFGGLGWSDIGKSLVAIGGSLVLLAVGLKAMTGTFFGSAALMVASVALVVLTGALASISLLQPAQIVKALLTIGASLIILAVGLTAMIAALPGAAALIVASVGLTMFAGALAVISALSWGSIGKGLGAIAATFGVLAISALVLAPLIPVVLALSVALALIGVASLATGIGITLLATGLTAFAAAFMAAAPMVVSGIKTIVTGLISLVPAMIEAFGNGIIQVCEVIIKAAPKIGEALITVVNTLCDVLIKCVPKIVTVIFELLVKVLDALGTYTPKIVDAIFKFIIGLLQGLARHMPALIQSLVDIFMSIFQGAIDALKSIDPDTLIKGILAIGFMAAIAAALAAVASLIPMAMVGALGLGALIAELALVIAAIGKLAQIEGLTWLVGEGGKLMAKVGEAIGGFVGSIIGSALEGISASFPQIGTDLSDFMRNVQPFIDGATSIKPETLAGVKSLVGIILALTAANVLDSLTKWFTGGSSLEDFGKQLIPFGIYMALFSSIISGRVDEGAVTATANAAALMAAMAATIPNTGGLVSFFTGDNDIATFGAKLIPFGTCMVAFSRIVSGNIDVGAVTAAANAGSAMAEMAATLPNTGGLVSFFTGDNDIVMFGAKLVPFGAAIAAFSAMVTGKIDEGAVTAAANAGNAMATMSSTLPKTGGLVSWFTGDNDMGKFGAQLVAFGAAMVLFSAEVSGKIDEGAVTATATAGSALATMAATIPNTGGVFSWFSGDNDMKEFGNQLVAFGAAIRLYSVEVTGMNLAAINNATVGIQSIITAAKDASGTDFGGLKSLASSLGDMGKLCVDKFCKAFGNAASKIEKAGKSLATNLKKGIKDEADSIKKIFNDTAKAAITLETRVTDASWNAGAQLVFGFIEGISDNSYRAKLAAEAMARIAIDAAKAKLDEHSPSRVFYGIGDFAGQGFVNALTSYESVSYQAGSDMAGGAIDGVNNSISHLADIVNSDLDVQPTIRPVLDLSDVEAGAGTIGSLFNSEQSVGVLANVGAISSSMNKRSQNGVFDELMSEFRGLRKDIGSAEHTSYNINGISFEEGSDVAEALRTIVRAAKIERRR